MSIIPGMENLAPLRTETSSGSLGVAELLAHQRLEALPGSSRSLVDLRRAASRRCSTKRLQAAVEIVKPGRHGQAGVGHLRQAGALAAEQCPSCPCCRPPCRRRRSRRTGSTLSLRASRCPRCDRRARAACAEQAEAVGAHLRVLRHHEHVVEEAVHRRRAAPASDAQPRLVAAVGARSRPDRRVQLALRVLLKQRRVHGGRRRLVAQDVLGALERDRQVLEVLAWPPRARGAAPAAARSASCGSSRASGSRAPSTASTSSGGEAAGDEHVAQAVEQEGLEVARDLRAPAASAARRSPRAAAAISARRLGRCSRAVGGQKSSSTRTAPWAARRRPKGSLLPVGTSPRPK